MKSNNGRSRFRVFGQRSIVPSSSSSPSCGPANGGFNGGSRVSLSEFLNRKLPKPALTARTVQCQLKPFSMLLESRDPLLLDDCRGGDKSGVQEEKDIHKGIFHQLKLIDKEKEDCAVTGSLDEGGSFQAEEKVQESRKRRNPFQEGENISEKHVIVLGKGREPKAKGRRESFVTNKKPKPEYNHYENGGGFWDSSMLGIDNEEVGFSEVWEGVGSTTLGGIEWH